MTRSREWTKWRRQIARKCDDLVYECGGDKPAVGLRDIATRCGIRRVVFRPLFVEGGIGRLRNGFVMYVKCAPEFVEEYSEQFFSGGGRDLPKRTRFTIAHEIAHTFFFDKRQSPPAPLVETSSGKDLEQLESACDEAANRILLPENRINSILRDGGLLSPERMLRLSDELSVSLQVLLMRLKKIRLWAKESGIVAVVDTFGEFPTIDCVAVDRTAESLFPRAKPREDVRTIIEDSDISLLSGDGEQRSIVIHGRNGVVQPCIARTRAINKQATKYLLAVSLDGPPKTP